MTPEHSLLVYSDRSSGYPRSSRCLTLTAIFIVLIGAILNIFVGGGFIFLLADQYRNFATVSFFILLPLLWVALSRSEKETYALHTRFPTNWVRWLMTPLVVITAALFVVFAPLGWFSLYGWAAGTPSNLNSAQVISVGKYHVHSRGCDQSAILAVGAIKGSICLEGRLSGSTPSTGSTVTIAARKSSLGIYIDEVRAN